MSKVCRDDMPCEVKKTTHCVVFWGVEKVEKFIDATKGKNALAAVGVNFTLIELDECGEERNGDVQTILHSINGCRSVPNIISPKGFVGGGDETHQLQKAGTLKALLEDAGCSFGE